MRRPRAALIAFLVTALAGLAAMAAVGATDERALAFTLGVLPGGPAAELRAADEACQGPIPVPEAFDAVELQVGTFGRPGAQLELRVVRSPGGEELAQGRVAGGYEDVSRPVASVGRVDAGQRVSVCVRNAGERRVAIYGAPDIAGKGSVTQNGDRVAADLTLVFLREQPRSALASLPDMLERAALFKPSWIGAWTLWILAALTLLGLPALLALALRAAAAAPSGRSGPPAP